MKSTTEQAQRHVRGWLVMLGMLSARNMSDEEAEANLCLMTPMLANRFPAEAFTPESAAKVAEASPYTFPTYGQIVAAVKEWWRLHDPAPRVVGLPAREAPRLEEAPVDQHAVAELNDPAEIERRIRNLEVQPRDRWTARGAKQIRDGLGRFAPHLLPRFVARLDALAGPKVPEVQPMRDATPLPRRGAGRPGHVTGDALAELRRGYVRNPAGSADG